MPTPTPTKKIPDPPADETPRYFSNDEIYRILELTSQNSNTFLQLATMRSEQLEKRIAELENVVAGLIADVYQEGKIPQEFDMNEGLIVNITQVAKTLGVSRPTVYRLIESGALPAKKLSTGSDTSPRTVVLSEDLKRFLSELPSADESPKEST